MIYKMLGDSLVANYALYLKLKFVQNYNIKTFKLKQQKKKERDIFLTILYDEKMLS